MLSHALNLKFGAQKLGTSRIHNMVELKPTGSVYLDGLTVNFGQLRRDRA